MFCPPLSDETWPRNVAQKRGPNVTLEMKMISSRLLWTQICGSTSNLLHRYSAQTVVSKSHGKKTQRRKTVCHSRAAFLSCPPLSETHRYGFTHSEQGKVRRHITVMPVIFHSPFPTTDRCGFTHRDNFMLIGLDTNWRTDL